MPLDPARARAWRATCARCSGALVLVLIAWRAVAGLGRFGGELLWTPLSERRRACTSSVEERLRVTRGDEVELWLALRAHVGAEDWLYVSYAEDARGRELFRRLQRLRALLCPTALKGLPFDASRAPLRLPRGGRGLVLDLDSGRALETLGRCEELARGTGFRLARVQAEEGAAR